jgi:hypothetical protein
MQPSNIKISSHPLDVDQIAHVAYITSDSKTRVMTHADFCSLVETTTWFAGVLSHALNKHGTFYTLETGVIHQPSDPVVFITTTANYTMSDTTYNSAGLFANLFNKGFLIKPKSVGAFNSAISDSRMILPNPQLDTQHKFTNIWGFINYADSGLIEKVWKRIGRESRLYLKKHNVLYMKSCSRYVNYFQFRLSIKTDQHTNHQLNTITRVHAFISSLV